MKPQLDEQTRTAIEELKNTIWSLNQFNPRETPPITPTQLQITNILVCSIRIMVRYFISATHIITKTMMKQSKGLSGDLRP